MAVQTPNLGKGNNGREILPDQNGPDQGTGVKDRNVKAQGRWVW